MMLYFLHMLKELTMEKVTFPGTITPDHDIVSFIKWLHNNLLAITLETLDYHL